jgi:hypothetical protein
VVPAFGLLEAVSNGTLDGRPRGVGLWLPQLLYK